MLENNYVTLDFLKKLTYGILSIKKEFANVSDDYKPTYAEILEGKYFPMFKDNISANRIIVGLKLLEEYSDKTSYVDKKDVVVIYPKLASVLIDNDILSLCPCGDEETINTYGIFKIIQRGEEIEQCLEERKCKVNPILSCNNNAFIINGNAISADKNTSDKRSEGIVTATYIYSGSTHTNSIIVKQEPNTISDWIYENETVDGIKISVSKPLLSNGGDTTTFTVKKLFTKHYIKRDGCGNVLMNSTKDGFVEDITSLCSVELTNNAAFKRKGNVISVDSQEVGNSERNCIITAKYLNFVSSVKIIQEKGGEITYGYTLKFDDEHLDELNYVMDSFKDADILIPIISTKDMYIDGNYHSSIPFNSLRLVNDTANNTDWVSYSITEDKKGRMNILARVKSPNLDRENVRSSRISYQNIEDPTKIITLNLTQPFCKKLRTDYSIILDGFDTYDNTNIDNCKLTIYPLVQDVFEDGRCVKHDISDPKMYFTYNCQSTDSQILDGGVLKRISFDGVHELTISHDINDSINDVILCCNFYLHGENGEILAKRENVRMVYKHSDIETYTYSFEYVGDCNLYWDYNDISKKMLKVKSCKNIFVDGYLKGEEPIGFSLRKTKGEPHFSLRKIDDSTLEARPLKVNEESKLIECSYQLTQDDTNKLLNTSLTHFKGVRTHFLKLMIYFTSNELKCDTWLENEPICDVCDDADNVLKSYNMQVGWLMKELPNCKDLILSQDMECEIGKTYKIKIKNIVYGTQEIGGNRIKDKTYVFVPNTEDDTVTIDLKI